MPVSRHVFTSTILIYSWQSLNGIFLCSDPPLSEEDIPAGLWMCHTCTMTQKLRKENTTKVNILEEKLPHIQYRRSVDSRSSTPLLAENARLRLNQKRSLSQASSSTDVMHKELCIKIPRLDVEAVERASNRSESTAKEPPTETDVEETVPEKVEISIELSAEAEIKETATAEDVSQANIVQNEDIFMPNDGTISAHSTNSPNDVKPETDDDTKIIAADDATIDIDRKDSVDNTGPTEEMRTASETDVETDKLPASNEDTLRVEDEPKCEENNDETAPEILEEQTTADYGKIDIDVGNVMTQEDACKSAELSTENNDKTDDVEKVENECLKEIVDELESDKKAHDGDEPKSDIATVDDTILNDNAMEVVGILESDNLHVGDEKLATDNTSEINRELESDTKNVENINIETLEEINVDEDNQNKEDDDADEDIQIGVNPFDVLIQAASILNPRQFELPREMNIFPQFPGDEKSNCIFKMSFLFGNTCRALSRFDC